MILRHVLGLPETPLYNFLFLTFGGLALYFLLSGVSYFIFFVAGRSHFHPTYQPEPAVLRNQIKWGVIGTLGNALLTMPFHLMIANGYSQIYWDISQYGWPWLIGSFILYLVWTETWIYWIHRWLHTDVGYNWLHKYHHEWRVTTSWVSMAFHPLDSFMQALPHHVFGFIFPLHGGIYLAMVSLVSVWSVIIHDRVSIVKWNVINYTGHHTLHHYFFKYNYGQFFTFWDKAMGTHRDPEVAAREDNIPEGVLR